MGYISGQQEMYMLAILTRTKEKVWDIMYGLKAESIEGSGKLNACMALED